MMIQQLTIDEIDQIISFLQETYPYELIKRLEQLRTETEFHIKLENSRLIAKMDEGFAMNDIIDEVFGIDKTNQIFNLWFEINFLRLVLNRVLVLNPSLSDNLTEECLNQAREGAKEEVRKRFPNYKITFNPPDNPNEDQEEVPACTPQAQQEEQLSFLPPSNMT